MFPARPARILILAFNDNRGRHWAESLDGTGARVWLATCDAPENEPVEIILTDLVSPEVLKERAEPVIGETASQIGRHGPLGVVTVGSDWGDVALGEDCTPNELRLACALLSEIVRLRRERDEQARGQRETQALADTDPLTGLANRRVWERDLMGKFAHAADGGAALCLAIVDLDSFKAVNDACGFAVGDKILHSVAGALAGQLRREDVLARLGGDEFGVLLCSLDGQSIATILDRLRSVVSAITVAAELPLQTASIGYAIKDAGQTAPADLFAAAERALREAKRDGGDRITQAK